MRLKFKFNYANAIRCIYALIVLLNIVALFYFYSFIKDYIYYTIAPDENSIIFKAGVSYEDINMNKFDNAINQLDKKSIRNNVDDINNIFN